MSAASSSGQVERERVEGTVLFPPVLGLERRPEGPRARLANTVRTADGDYTIVFQGDRAEVAERLLRTGDRRIRALGVWDEPRTVFTVDRFDVLDADPSHRYRIDWQRNTGVVHDVDVSSLYPPEARSDATPPASPDAHRRQQVDDARPPSSIEADEPGQGDDRSTDPGTTSLHRPAATEAVSGSDGSSTQARRQVLQVHARRLEPSGELLL